MIRALLILTLSVSSIASAETPAWNVQQLMQSLAQVKESRGTFVERKYLSVLNRPLESSGTLQFLAPAHLEKHTLSPQNESLVLDQRVLTIDNRARNIKRTLILQEYPAIWAFVESIRSTLAGDLPTLEHFYRIELEGDATHWKMRLLPIEAKTREAINEIRIGGRGNRVESIETLEPSGDHALMKIIEDTP